MQDSETPGKRRDWILIASLIMLAMLIFAIKEPSITGFGVQNIEDNYTANDSVENTTVDSGMAIEGITSENGSESITATQNPEQEYGILSTISNCSIISTADSYTLNQNIAGAPNSASPVTGTACIKITKSNVLFDCAGFNITNNGTAGTTYGILLNGTVTNVTVQNCPSISKYTYGVYLHTNSNNSQLLNNTAWNNSNTGFYFTGSKFNNLTNNNAYNNTNGFYFYTSCDNNNLNNNNAYNNTGYGFGFYSTNNNNTLINNSAYQNSPAGGGYSGFYLRSSSYNNLTNNTAYKNNGTYGAFYFTTSSNNNVLTNNTAYNNTNGFYLTSSSNNTFTINTVYNHTMHGFYLNSNANNNTINNNTAYNNTQYGFFIGGSSRNNNLTDNTAYNDYHGFYIAAGFSNILTSNTAYKNSYHGFYLSGSSDNTLNNNTAYNNTRHGFDLEASSNNNILTNNIAYQNNPAGGGNYAGFYLTSSNNNTLTNNVAYLNKGNYGSFCLAASSNNTLNNNTAYNNTLYGIYLYSNSNNNTLNNNTAYNNTQYGIYISSSNATTATNTHLYNNPLSDFYIVADATARTINFYNITFDNPAGNMQNYTSIDITDTLTSESYKINWSKNSTSLPVNTTSFQQKYINIVRVTGTVSIDILKWTWQSNELTGYDVNKMDLWKYNTSWTKVNSNLNTNENTLTTASLNPASTYAVVQNLRNYPYCTDDNNGLWNITSDTTISTNQICKAINIMNNAILYVNSTPTSSAVSITAENLAIYDGSSINATASGYDGGAISSDGYGPGKGLIETVTGYYYYGSGGGHGGIGGGGGDTNQAIGGAAYDNITWPTQPGSGGAGGNAGVGGKGGGAIILNITNTLNNSGSILANGQDTGANNAGTGAGGSVLINTATYTGNGTINASAGTTTQGAGGGGGRIAIYYTTNSNTGETQAYGGTSASYGQNGAAGTIYKKPASQTYGDLIIEDNNPAMPYPYTGDSVPKTPLSVTYGLPATINNINITNKASVDLTSDLTINNTILDFNNETRLDLYSVLNASNLATFNLTGKLSYSGGQIIMPNAVLTINSGGVIIHSFNNQSDTYKINLTLTNLTILPGGIINSSNAGYAGGPVSNIDGYGPGKGTFGATYWGSAAGHGGKGGLSGGGGYEEQLGGDPYDNMTAPTQSGSGGASGNTGLGGKGGGVIILNVSDTLNNSGSIVADGETIGGSANSGGGAGGSILINAGTYAGAGSTAANGGSCDSGGGGAGGRIAIYYATNKYTATPAVTGGTPGTYGTTGEVGTVFRCFNQYGVSCYGDSRDYLVMENSTVKLITNYSTTNKITITKKSVAAWSQSSLSWNETFSATGSATYNITGLTVNTNYTLYENTTNFANSTTDSSGNLPLFSRSFSTTEKTFTVNTTATPPTDTTAPSISFVTPTETSGTTVSRSYIQTNVTATDSGGLANITAYLYNSSGSLINSSYSTTSPLFTNVTGLANGLYYFNATAYDTSGNKNSTEQRNVTVNTQSNGLVISSSGTYEMNNSFTGAPNDATEIYQGYKTSVKISSSNVVFDCKGYSITNDGTDNSTAIFLNGSASNVTIKNCPAITGYSYVAMYLKNTDNNTITNITIYNNSKDGIQLDNSDNNKIENIVLYGNGKISSGYEIMLGASANQNNLTNITIYTNKTGYETVRYYRQLETATPSNNLINFSICFNETVGCASWDFVNTSYSNLISSNYLSNPTFISLNDSAVPEFNKSANITIEKNVSCSKITYYKKTGFPTSISEITSSGTKFTPAYSQCNDTTNITTFSVSSFSGYASYGDDSTLPSVEFVPPTPDSGTTQSATSFYVNVSSSDANDHYTILDWNRSLALWMRFENQSGENSSYFMDESSYSNNGTCTYASDTTTNLLANKDWDMEATGTANWTAYNPGPTVISKSTDNPYSGSQSMLANMTMTSNGGIGMTTTSPLSPNKYYYITFKARATGNIWVAVYAPGGTDATVGMMNTSWQTYSKLMKTGSGSTFYIYTNTGTSNHSMWVDEVNITEANLCPTFDTSGKFGKALTFDGVDDNILVGTNPAIDGKNFTLSAWVKTTVTTGGHGVITNDKNDNGIIALRTDSGNAMLQVRDVTGSPSILTITGKAVNDGNWHHLAGVKDGNNFYLYVDGVLNGSGQNNGTDFQHSNWYIGARDVLPIGASSHLFNGTIDEAQIYSRALSAEEINASYNATAYKYYNNFTSLADGTYNYTAYAVDAAGNKNSTEQRNVTINTAPSDTPPSIEFVPPTPDSGTTQNDTSVYVNVSSSDTNDHYTILDWNRSLVLWTRFENDSSRGENETVFNDESSWSNNGTCTVCSGGSCDGARCPDIVNNGVFGKAFNKTNGSFSYVEFSNTTADFGWDDSFTFTGWMRSNDTGMASFIGKGTGDTGIHIMVHDNKLKAWFVNSWVTDSIVAISSDNVNTGNWTHFAVTYNGNRLNTGIRIYLNGIDRTGDQLFTLSADFKRSANKFQLGSYNGWGGITGGLDDIQVYSRALSSEEIKASYNATAYKYSNNFTNLANGIYNYTAYAIDTAGNKNSTEERDVNISGNTLPTAPELSLPTNGQVIINRTPFFNWSNSTDADGDNITYFLYVDNDSDFSSPEISVETNETNYSSAAALDFTTYYWKVGANDTKDITYSDVWNFTLIKNVECYLPVNTVNFSTMNPGDSKDTLSDNPPPFILQNKGNTEVNVSINATKWFNSKPAASEYYQFRIGENKSYSFESGLTDIWYNMSLDSPLASITNLKYFDESDDARIDLKVTAPYNEAGGPKNTTVYVYCEG